MKNIFCIRHGLAFHNIKAMEIGSDAYLMEECFDAPLVEKGIQQARDLGNQWKGVKQRREFKKAINELLTS